MKYYKTTTVFFVCMLVALFLSISVNANAESEQKPIELKVTTWNPAPPFPISASLKKWGEMVEKKSGGKVKLTFFWGGGLASRKDTYRAIQTGVADIGMWLPGTIPGVHSLNEYNRLPLLGADSMETATKVYHEMRKKFPELDAEFKGLRLLAATAMPPNQLHFTKKTGVRLPSDIKGIKLLGNASASDFINDTGAVIVNKAPSDYYMSLQKGLVQGAFQHWPFLSAFKLEELFASHTNCGRGGFSSQIIGYWMNQDVWERLPREVQKAFDDSQEWLQQEDIKINERLIDKAMARAKEMGHEIVELTSEEKEIWFKATEPIRQKWVADREAEGKPGKAVYQEALKLIEKYNK